MHLNEYQALAMRTAKMFPTLNENINHAALGIGSEAGELALTVAQAWMKMPFEVDNLSEEMGDASWYAALLCTVLELAFEDMILDPATASDMSNELAFAVVNRNPIAMTLLLSHFAGEVVSLVKAAVIYGKELDRVMLVRHLSLYVTTLNLLSDIHGFSYEKVTLRLNIEKLAKRYPDKYSDADAIARADKAIIIQ